MGEYVIIIVVCIKLFKEGKLKTKYNDQLRLPLYRNYLLEDTLLRRKDLFFPPDWAVRFTIIWSKITERALQRDKIC